MSYSKGEGYGPQHHKVCGLFDADVYYLAWTMAGVVCLAAAFIALIVSYLIYFGVDFAGAFNTLDNGAGMRYFFLFFSLSPVVVVVDGGRVVLARGWRVDVPSIAGKSHHALPLVFCFPALLATTNHAKIVCLYRCLFFFFCLNFPFCDGCHPYNHCSPTGGVFLVWFYLDLAILLFVLITGVTAVCTFVCDGHAGNTLLCYMCWLCIFLCSGLVLSLMFLLDTAGAIDIGTGNVTAQTGSYQVDFEDPGFEWASLILALLLNVCCLCGCITCAWCLQHHGHHGKPYTSRFQAVHHHHTTRLFGSSGPGRALPDPRPPLHGQESVGVVVARSTPQPPPSSAPAPQGPSRTTHGQQGPAQTVQGIRPAPREARPSSAVPAAASRRSRPSWSLRARSAAAPPAAAIRSSTASPPQRRGKRW